MSRMHSRKRGKAGSKKPEVTKNPEWVTIPPTEIESLVVKMTKEGMSTSLIGMKLRDQYGVPSIRLATGKDVTTILTENGLKQELPEDLNNLIKRSIELQGHMKVNPKDLENKRGLSLIDSKIKRLTKYYKRIGVISQDWIPASTIEAKAE